MSIDAMAQMINKTAGMSVAHSLEEDNPTEVKEWIPTGSTWLDAIICKGKRGGIPVGKIVELAGLPSTGKSYIVFLVIVFLIIGFLSKEHIKSDRSALLLLIRFINRNNRPRST